MDKPLDVFEDERFEQRMVFYTKLGFRPLKPKDDPKRLFLSMKDVRVDLDAKKRTKSGSS